MCRETIYNARNNFSSLVKLAESGELVELTRHDKPVAVIISYEEYEARKPKISFFEKMMKIREEYADVLSDPEWEGLPIPKDEYDTEEDLKKLRALWEED